MIAFLHCHRTGCLLALALLVTAAVYGPGLSGGFLFDDYPNIVDNPGVRPHSVSVASLVRAALSSPASEFKRPLASLSFAANYLAEGLNPWGWKLFNLVVHLLNGWLVFVLVSMLLGVPPPRGEASAHAAAGTASLPKAYAGIVAALVTAAWMLLPINLTAVLYVVQREESMANLFVLTGLVGYVAGRRRMLGLDRHDPSARRGLWLCAGSLVLGTGIGILVKETAVMLPLYAFTIEWIVFGFRRAPTRDGNLGERPVAHRVRSYGKVGAIEQIASGSLHVGAHPVRDDEPGEGPIAHEIRSYRRMDAAVIGLFTAILIVPLIIGLAWLLPGVLQASTWATRDFTLGTRLLSEARIVVDYIAWTLMPTPHALSFYHDDYRISTGLLSPWTTLTSMIVLAVLIATVVWLRKRRPLVALGIALFLGCQLLTATILPLELIYEHRNYFASFGLMLAVIPLLAAAPSMHKGFRQAPNHSRLGARRLPFALPRYVLLAALLLWWLALTALTSWQWGNPLRLAEELAERAPNSPRAQYELGRIYIMYSHYDLASPYTRLAYAPLERAASFPESSILPQQALIFMSARMHLPIKDAWWDSLIGKLRARKPGVQDESSLGALTQCAHDGRCDLPKRRMVEAFLAALSHPNPSPRLLASYGDYAWNVLDDHALGLRMTQAAVKAAPGEAAYRVTLIRMLISLGQKEQARSAMRRLERQNIGGDLNHYLIPLRAQLDDATPTP